jgi:hypothetical protein
MKQNTLNVLRTYNSMAYKQILLQKCQIQVLRLGPMEKSNCFAQTRYPDRHHTSSPSEKLNDRHLPTHIRKY